MIRLILGAMSGTSADGVDVALVEVRGRGVEMSARLRHFASLPFDEAMQHRIAAARSGPAITLAELARLGRDLSLAYATGAQIALRQAGVDATQISGYACHGQTLYHAPPDTIQWLDPALVAAITGVAVISDFRRADCAAGGQGAPLVPFADFLLFRHPEKNRVLLNIGGIANLTWLPAGGDIESSIAFDTGPGNCISDALCRAGEIGAFDEGGAMAMRGNAVASIVNRALTDPFFSTASPVSTDTPAMTAIFDRARQGSVGASLIDLLATAADLTAQTIALAVEGLPGRVDELIVSGGGVENEAIMSAVKKRMPAPAICRLEEVGMPSQAKEAVAFALLGAATLDGEPSNVPRATGARRRVVLGSITPKPSPD